MKLGKTEAETIALNGWKVGDILQGDEGYGPDRILIVAVGEECFICKWLNRETGEFGSESGNTTLRCREWRKVGFRAGQAARGQGGEAVAYFNPADTYWIENGGKVSVCGQKTDTFTQPLYTQPAPSVPEGHVAIPKDVAAAKGMYLVGYSWLKHNAPQEIATTPQPVDGWAGTDAQEIETLREMVEQRDVEIDRLRGRVSELEVGPDLFWDYHNPEDSGHEDEHDLADYCAQDLPYGETMTVDVMCAKRLPTRQMKIWVDDNDDMQWKWLPAEAAEKGGDDEQSKG